MAVTHPTAVRNTVCDAVVDLLDGGSTFGRLMLLDSGSTQVAEHQLGSTAFGGASTGLATASTIEDATALLSATVTICSIQASCSTEIIRGSITSTGGGGDIELSSNVLSSGQTISITSLTYAAMA